MLTFSSLQTNTDSFANSADPYETAQYEPSHQDLHSAILLLIFTETPICNNGCVQSKRWKSPCLQLGCESVNDRFHSVCLIIFQDNVPRSGSRTVIQEASRLWNLKFAHFLFSVKITSNKVY